ncbi:hypothetical protein AB0D10_40125 [Kitasatospora sp. NPDC048545]|uniref:hypothetical protein n=1 Tax=Kitasatospora sp. NPDC048545 TaxID=3157208 RepID=UPI0033FD10FA
MLRLIAADAGVLELTELHRFSVKTEAAATLKIRVGDGSGLDFYFTNQRVVSGSRTAMITSRTSPGTWSRTTTRPGRCTPGSTSATS